MRITNSMMVDRVLSNLNKGLLKSNKYNMQLSSNRKITRLSDDPVGVMSSMKARLNIRKVSRYQENVTAARSWVDESETALMDIQNVLVTIKENTISACSTTNEDDKQNIAKLIEGLTDHILQSCNTTVGDKYIFAGFNTTRRPFERVDGKVIYNGIDLTEDPPADPALLANERGQILEYEVSQTLNLAVSFTGIDVVGTGDQNMFKILDNLVTDLKSGMSNEELGEKYIDELEDLRDRVMVNVVEVGTRSVRLDLLENRYGQDAINNEAIRTDVEDIDQAEVIMNMLLSETIYRQALSVGARVIQPTLMDFLN